MLLYNLPYMINAWSLVYKGIHNNFHFLIIVFKNERLHKPSEVGWCEVNILRHGLYVAPLKLYSAHTSRS